MEGQLVSEQDQERGGLGAALPRGASCHQSWRDARLTHATRTLLSHPHGKTKARLQEAKESRTHTVSEGGLVLTDLWAWKEMKQAWGCGQAGREHCHLSPPC